MKLSEVWLRELVNPALTTAELCNQLTFCGLEVESYIPVAEKFSHVVIGQVLKVEKHPEADRLHVCQVTVGKPEILTIVCGATNVKPDMKVPVALVGAELPNNIKISRSKLRGVVSNGMLCSARELTLAEESNGIYEFPADAPIGENVWDYFKLSDHMLDISITPNRGDCLSVVGLAREVAAITACDLEAPSLFPIDPTIDDKLTINMQVTEACPLYVGRILKNVNIRATTPIWLQERLRRSGLRSINPVVDVVNYVMLELGQPMHAFDLQKISGDITVRMARSNEELTLLDGQTVKLSEDALVIADDKQSLAIAGIMGGLDSGVTATTQDIFLESALFQAECIARTRQKYNLNSDSSYRFERGVQPALQVKAIERATELLIEIVGGEAGPVVDVTQHNYLPQLATIQLRPERIQKILGFAIDQNTVEVLLQRLGCFCEKNSSGWLITVPSYRLDITLEVDLIEEIIRLYGYEKLPLHQPLASLQVNKSFEKTSGVTQIRQSLCDAGYHEVISYSFISQKMQKLFDPALQPKELINPMTAEMSVMRTNLWPGLVETLLYNQNRQQTRARLFEIGLRFVPQDKEISQQRVVSGLVNGGVFPEQWGVSSRGVDFFDVKGDLEVLLHSCGLMTDVQFIPTQHSALHPGQSAEIQNKGQSLGVFGTLHPSIVQDIGIIGKVVVFELMLDKILMAQVPQVMELSKFPEIRRDIAIYVDQTVPAQQIQDTIVEVGGKLLKEVNVFDVYQGKGVPPNRKSIALALTLQHTSRTLMDEEVADIMSKVISALKQRFAAELRG